MTSVSSKPTTSQIFSSLDSARNNYERLQALVLTSAEKVVSSASRQVLTVRPDEWITRLNELLAASSFDWCLLLRAGDELTPSGLMMAGLELLTAPDCRAIYCDAVSYTHLTLPTILLV